MVQKNLSYKIKKLVLQSGRAYGEYDRELKISIVP